MLVALVPRSRSRPCQVQLRQRPHAPGKTCRPCMQWKLSQAPRALPAPALEVAQINMDGQIHFNMFKSRSLSGFQGRNCRPEYMMLHVEFLFSDVQSWGAADACLPSLWGSNKKESMQAGFWCFGVGWFLSCSWPALSLCSGADSREDGPASS